MPNENKLVEAFVQNHPEEAVKLVEKQSDQNIGRLISVLPAATGSKLFNRLDLQRASQVLKIMDLPVASALLDHLPLSSASVLLRVLDHNYRDKLLATVSQDKQKQIIRSLNFPADSVGAHMDPAIFTLDQHLTVPECLERVTSYAEELGNYIMVTNESRQLIGYLRIQELLAADPKKKANNLLKSDIPAILADTRISENLLEDLNLDLPWNYFPVVDSEDILLGLISKSRLSQVKPTEKSSVRQAWQASGALAELYQIGLTSLFRSTND